MSSKHKAYIGDGVYAELIHGELILTTENGISVTNRIVLGVNEWGSLKEWIKSLTEEAGT